MRWLYPILFTGVLTACRPARELEAPPSAASPTIGFLSFRMVDDRVAPPRIRLLGYERSTGVLKPQHRGFEVPDHLTMLLYRRGKLLDSQQVAHPLLPRAEVVGESGSFESLQGRLDSAEFFIRIQTARQPDELRVLEYRFGQRVRQLVPISIPQS